MAFKGIIKKCFFLLILEVSIFPCKAIPLEMPETDQPEIQSENKDGYNVKIIMPIQWINKIFGFDYTNDSNSLAGEFA